MSDVILSCTGTRWQPSIAQRASFRDYITHLQPAEFHHGSCTGADEAMVILVAVHSPNTQIVAHPGVYANGRANLHHSVIAQKLSHHTEAPMTMFSRNRRLANICTLLAAMPIVESVDELLQSRIGGTAFTTGVALTRYNKPVVIFLPDGTVAHEPRTEESKKESSQALPET